MATLLVLGVLLVVLVCLQWLFVWLSARIARIPGATFGRSGLAVLFLFLASIVLLAAFGVLKPNQVETTLALLAGQFLVTLLATGVILSVTLRSSFPRAILASVPYLVLSIALSAGLVFGLKG